MATDLRHELGEALRDARVRAGRTLVEVGEACGVSHATVSRWETGKHLIPSEKLEAAAAFLGCSLGVYLYAGAKSPHHARLVSAGEVSLLGTYLTDAVEKLDSRRRGMLREYADMLIKAQRFDAAADGDVPHEARKLP